ncbi:Arylsulfatase precursor [Symmachiella dynata]|uniref:Arylsulfatase n=1 Tax=Symmachiella dynata TaxID=2527995 RepID=A0A517ZTB2_9PLAN|nr:arylsulfatase [Symmachiella dynata]QDU45683.1 Arylsulfatase precursor [Symmachiella dynata]
MRAFLILVGLCGLVGFVDAATVAAADRPNVILIMTDDQGYGDLGATGNPLIRTPNIDAMAKRSAQMERFYVSPVCAPTRACLMTGRYNYRTRAIDTYIGRAMMETDEVTIAEMLGAAGYATGIFGKWHLGDNYPIRAMDQGFQESFVIRGGGIGQPSDPPGGEGKYTDPILFHNGQEAPQTGYCTDLYFDAAMNWIETQHDSRTPFFAYIPTNAPHGPFDDVPETEYAQYKKVDLGNDQFPQETGHRLPKKANQDKRARIFAMISNVDANVGRLFEKLDALKITDNTVVIFMVDNGPNGMRYVAGMRGMKSRVHEGGVRSPFYVHWPARLKAGQSSDRIAAHIDVLPTLLDACEVPVPEGVQLDGRSVLPLLEGKADDWPDRTIYIQAHRGDVPVRFHNFVAINQDWTLLNDSGFGREKLPRPPKFELYDMTADPLQMHNVVAEQADVAKQMRQAYETWFDDVSSTREDNYAPPRIYLGTPHENPVVLTRQDWRRTSRDSGWQPDSRGYWELFVATAGRYDVTVTYKPRAYKETLSLKMGGKTLTADVAADSTEHTFRDVELTAGDARLTLDLVRVGKREAVRGPWQVSVSKQAETTK